MILDALQGLGQQVTESGKVDYSDLKCINIIRLSTVDGEKQAAQIIDCDGKPTYIYVDLSKKEQQQTTQAEEHIKHATEGRWIYAQPAGLEANQAKLSQAIELGIDPALAVHLAFNRPDIEVSDYQKYSNTKLVPIWGFSREGKTQLAFAMQLLGANVVNFDHRSSKNLDYLMQQINPGDANNPKTVWDKIDRAINTPGGSPINYAYAIRHGYDVLLSKIDSGEFGTNKTVFIDFPGISRSQEGQNRPAHIFDVAAQLSFSDGICPSREEFETMDAGYYYQIASHAAQLILEKYGVPIPSLSEAALSDLNEWCQRLDGVSNQKQLLLSLFPEIDQIPVKYGFTTGVIDGFSGVYDERTRRISMHFPMGYVETELKYMRLNDPETTALRSAILGRIDELIASEEWRGFIPVLQQLRSELAIDLSQKFPHDREKTSDEATEFSDLSLLGFGNIESLVEARQLALATAEKLALYIYQPALESPLVRELVTVKLLPIKMHEAGHAVFDSISDDPRFTKADIPVLALMQEVNAGRGNLDLGDLVSRCYQEDSLMPLVEANRQLTDIMLRDLSPADQGRWREIFKSRARSEIFARTIELLAGGKEGLFGMDQFAHYAVGAGVYIFDQDPNTIIKILVTAVENAVDADAARSLLTEYITNGAIPAT